MEFKIKIEPEAHEDIQEGIDWYNKKQRGLGRKFHTQVKTFFKHLETNPFYEVRYNDVRCLPLKKYPYMIHFTVDEKSKLVTVRAVFNTSKDPNIWKERT